MMASFTGPWNDEPDPLYFELKDQIDGICFVITSWIEQVGDHRYTQSMRDDLEKLNYKLALFLSSLESPAPESLKVPNDLGVPEVPNDEYFEHLKNEFADFKRMVEIMQEPRKRLRHTPSGGEAPDAQMIGSSSQSALTIEADAEDTDCAHHGQPEPIRQ
jgi:hypothetical protein